MRRSILLLATVVFFIACGQPSQPLPIEATAEKTIAQGTAKTYTKQVMAFENESQGTLTMESNGVIDFETLTQEATMTASGEGGQAEAIAAEMGTTKLVSEGLVAYFQSALYDRFLEPGTEWVKLDLQAAGEKMGMDLGSLTQVGSNDPTQQFDYLMGIEDIEEVGTEDVRGATTTHYRGTGSFDAAKEELPDDAAETIERIQEIMDIDSFDIDIWIDDEGLTRRMSFVYDRIPMGTTVTDGSWTMLMEYYDFGTKLDVEIPPDEEVTDLLEVMSERDDV
ncbi:MAG: hypothetical protein KY391_04180 [Actinobacteria bacterium]|nr:hypothetical protein [Actinomycetota bacterium]